MRIKALLVAAVLVAAGSAQAGTINASIGAYASYSGGDAGTFRFTVPGGNAITSASVKLKGVDVDYSPGADFLLDGVALGSQGFSSRPVNDTFVVTNLSSLADGAAVLSVQQDYYSGATYQSFNSGTLSIVYASGVPEPATWTLSIGGFGLVGNILRRRRAGARFISS